MAPRVILWTYEHSPFGNKIRMVLSIRKIPFILVPVSIIPPRPELQGLGITYRRIPVLAIDSDVYIESSHIIRALEAAFPDSEEHPSIYGRQAKRAIPALQQEIVEAWADNKIFTTSTALLPWGKGMANEAFMKDREKFTGGKIDPEKAAKMRPFALVQMKALLAKVEQYVTGRSQDDKTLVDVALSSVLIWVRSQKFAPDLFDGVDQKTLEWFDEMQSILDGSKDLVQETVKDKAIAKVAAYIRNAPAQPRQQVTKYRDPTGVNIGDQVVLTPNDTGRIGQKGEVLFISGEEVVILPEKGYEGGPSLQLHAPRLNYTVIRAKTARM